MVPVLCNMDMHSNCEWWIALESALKMHSLKSAALCICEAFRNGWKIRYGWIEIPAKFRGKVNINNSSSNNHLLILQPWLSVTPPPHHPYPHSEYPGKRTRDCKGVTRIGGGSLCVKQRVLTRLSNRPIRHISLNETKRLTKGESRAPRIPPSHTLGWLFLRNGERGKIPYTFEYFITAKFMQMRCKFILHQSLYTPH